MDVSVSSPPTVSTVPLLSTRARVLRVLVAGASGAGGYWLAPADFPRSVQLLMTWDGFILSILLLSWYTMLRADEQYIRLTAARFHPDRTRLPMLLITLLGSVASLLAVLLVLHDVILLSYEERVERMIVSVVTIFTSWLLLHTLFTLRYAHTYFSRSLTPPYEQLGGLQFSGSPPTTYWDFAYFAFVIGMSAQTSDVGVNSLRMRQLVLYHSLLAFGFNTAVLALSINLFSDML